MYVVLSYIVLSYWSWELLNSDHTCISILISAYCIDLQIHQ